MITNQRGTAASWTHGLTLDRQGVSTSWAWGGLVGALMFLLVLGPAALDPTNIAWLNQGDRSQHLVGWLFYRQGPWAWPLGANPDYGLEIANGVAYTDSIPLFAIPFKLLAPLLPTPFQYFGLWFLLCFVLQGVFAWQLMGLASARPAVRAFGAALFCLAPPMLARLPDHGALVGHWLLLAALWLHLGAVRRRALWFPILLALAALTHAYLAVMVGVLWLADLVQRGLGRERTIPQLAGELAGGLLLGLLAMWQAGFFTIGRGLAGDGGYGRYRLNLLSLVDANGDWSHVLPDIPDATGDYEGFAFLGAGLLGGAVLALVLAWMRGVRPRLAPRHFPLAAACVGLTVFALSNAVQIGLVGLPALPLPRLVLDLANIFQSSGRMFWPVFYVLVLAILWLLCRVLPPRWAAATLGVLLAVQFADSSAARRERHVPSGQAAAAWETPLVSDFWPAAARHYRRLRVLPPTVYHPDTYEGAWWTLPYYAVTHGLAINVGSFARVDRDRLASATKAEMQALLAGSFDSEALYILSDGTARIAQYTIAADDLLTVIDGYTVLAPGWRACAPCRAVAVPDRLLAVPDPVPLDEDIPFARGTPGTELLGLGWHEPEAWGVWSGAGEALLFLPVPAEAEGDLVLTATAHAFVRPAHPRQDIEVWVAGEKLTSWTFTLDRNRGPRTVTIPAETVRRATGRTLLVRLVAPDAASPSSLGGSPDPRPLGMGLLRLRLSPA